MAFLKNLSKSGTGQFDCLFGSFLCPSRMALIIQASGEALEGK